MTMVSDCQNTALFKYFSDIHKSSGLKFYDAHTHPLDVLGVVDINRGKRHQGDVYTPPPPSIVEKFQYDTKALKILDLCFRFVPEYVRQSVAHAFKGFSRDSLIDVLDEAHIDVATLIPVAPYSVTTQLHGQFGNSERFLYLGTVDVANTPASDVERNIAAQKNNFSIRGIKLHPNIQQFDPRPEKNNTSIADTLTAIYRTANKYQLYILFHGGFSYVTDSSNKNRFKKVGYARLENYIDPDNSHSVLNKLDVPVVIAHLGNYNVTKPDFELIKKVASKYENVFFDTAGINPRFIEVFVRQNGFEKLIFGSDTIYFNLVHAINLILPALKKTAPSKNFEAAIQAVFSVNYQKILQSCSA